ncbi:MAG: DUF2066 domain-containing protein [Gammaproteobacteria bacterium]|nr:DUF2066 domain-containing protein [Gammaproteobacteria bacterium]
MKTFNFDKFLLPVLFLFWIGGADAAVVQGLYESEKLVVNQTKAKREEAMKNALIEVLAKVSGRPDVGTLPNIAAALEKPANYVQQYRYKKIPEKGYISAEAVQGSQLIWLLFDEQAVNKLLQKNNLPVWGRTRPTTLVWLAVEQDGERFLIGSNSQEEIRFALDNEAKRRGVVTVLPLLDIEDQQKLTFAEVWNNNQEPIFQASTRYQAEAILVGRISISANDSWQGRWVLYEGGQGLSWNAQGSSVNQLLDSGVMGTLEILGSRYAQVYDDSSPSVFDIAIVDIRSLSQFARVSQYLQSLEQVQNVYTTHVDSNSVTYRLDIRGNSKGLVQTIGLGNVLAAVATPGTSGNTGGSPIQGLEGGQQIQIQETAPTTAHIYRLLP